MGIKSKELIAIPALGLSINNGNFDEVILLIMLLL